MAFAECPSCGTRVNVGGKAKMGQRFTCAACDTVSEIVWLDPIELDWPFENDDDDDDDYDDEN